MNKKILFGSIIAVAILVGLSLTSVVGGNMELEKEPYIDVGRFIKYFYYYIVISKKPSYIFPDFIP